MTDKLLYPHLDLDVDRAVQICGQKQFGSIQPFVDMHTLLENLEDEFGIGVLRPCIEKPQREKIRKQGTEDLIVEILITCAEDKIKEKLFELAERRSSTDLSIYFSNSESDIRKAEKTGLETFFMEFEDLNETPAETIEEAIS